MKRFYAAILACLMAGAAATTFAQCDDPYDANLCVYKVPDADTGNWAVDGAVSDFWTAGDFETGDYIEMIVGDNCYPDRCNFSGPDDAKLTLKAGASAVGLYVYVAVEDNTWVDPTGTYYGDDSVDLYFDAMSANDIFTCTDCLVGLYSSTLTYTTQQFQVFMGATSLPTGCQYQNYDENLWSWQEMGLTWQAAEVLYGFRVDVISETATKKVQEWFFPWEKFGQGIAEGTTLDGMKFGFSGGYNDMDGDAANADCLRWLGKDPWASDAQTTNYWGDFEIQAGVGDVTYGAISVKPNTTGRVAASSALKSVEHFNLQGQRIAPQAVRALPVGSTVLKRTTFADGSNTAEMLRIGR